MTADDIARIAFATVSTTLAATAIVLPRHVPWRTSRKVVIWLWAIPLTAASAWWWYAALGPEPDGAAFWLSRTPHIGMWVAIVGQLWAINRDEHGHGHDRNDRHDDRPHRLGTHRRKRRMGPPARQ